MFVLKQKSRFFKRLFGGTWRIRTAVPGFADRSLTARARYHNFQIGCKGTAFFLICQIKNDFFAYFLALQAISAIRYRLLYWGRRVVTRRLNGYF